MANTIIIGAGGYSRVVIDNLSFNKDIKIIGFVDQTKEIHNKEKFGFKVFGDISMIPSLIKQYKIDSVFIAIGDQEARKKYSEEIKKYNLNLVNAIHPTAFVSSSAKLGKGIFIGAGCIIGPNVQIGDNCLIHHNVVLPNDNILEDYVHVSPGVNVGSATLMKEFSYIGLGSSILQYIKIGTGAVIGAGAVVTKDVNDNIVVIGVPAKPFKKRQDVKLKARI